jgi:hypothetical protein
MFALRILGVLTVLFVIWFFVTQILLPMILHRPLFSMFKGKDKELTGLNREVNDLHHKVTVLHEVKDLTEVKSSLEQEKTTLERDLASNKTTPEKE